MVRQWLTVFAVLMAIALNGLSNFYPPRGQNIGEVSNTTLGGVLMTPDGYAFAIWGLIYIGLITYSVYQVLPANRHKPTLAGISSGLIGACVLQMGWVYAFLSYRFWLSALLMFGIVACLAFAYLRSRTLNPTRNIRWLVQAPMSVYFGWITVAAVVNVASAVHLMENSAEIPVTGAMGWVIVLMCISGVIAYTVAAKYGDAAYPAVTVWALSAIAVRHAGTLQPIAVTGVVLAVALSVFIVRIVATGQGRLRKSGS